MAPESVAAFLRTIDCYGMSSFARAISNASSRSNWSRFRSIWLVGGGAVSGECLRRGVVDEYLDDKVDVVTALDDALQRLEEWDPRQSRILEERYFGGLSLDETAAALGVSLATVKRELRSARAWLSVQIRDDLVL